MLKQTHPAVGVTAGFFLIVLIQTLPALATLGLSVLLVFAALFLARAVWLRIVKRMRYVFLALFVLFAWQTPGTLLCPFMGALSPTLDGLRAGLDPALRLVAVMSVVAILLRRYSPDEWICGLHVLASPFRLCGFRVDRFAVRLRLVLEYVERRNLDWRHCLDAASREDELVGGEHWEMHSLSGRDCVLLSFLILLISGWLLW